MEIMTVAESSKFIVKGKTPCTHLLVFCLFRHIYPPVIYTSMLINIAGELIFYYSKRNLRIKSTTKLYNQLTYKNCKTQ